MVMDREAHAAMLEEGLSIESIARETGRSPSTVAYWVNKHGLASRHGPKHAARGGIERERLQALVEEGLSIRAIAAHCDVSPTTVRHWLQKYEPRRGPPATRGEMSLSPPAFFASARAMAGVHSYVSGSRAAIAVHGVTPRR